MRTFPVDAGEFRRNNFDFLRFLLASTVILSHCWPLLRGSDATEPLSRLTGGRLTLGGLSVNFFFVISGYLVANSWAFAPDFSRFLKKRAARIYPGYAAAVLLCLPVMWAAWDRHVPFPFLRRLAGAVWESLTLGFPSSPHAFIANPLPFVVNGSLWTVRFEFWCYIALAALGTAGLMSRRRAVAAAFVAAFAVASVLDITQTPIGWGTAVNWVFGEFRFWPRFATYFLAGVVFYLWRDRIPRSGLVAAPAALLLGLSMIKPWGLSLTLPSCGVFLLFSIAYAPLGVERFGRFGDFSYGIYLYAFPVQQLLVMWFRPGMTVLRLFLLAAPPAILAGALSWHFVEKHFLRRHSAAVVDRPSKQEAQQLLPT